MNPDTSTSQPTLPLSAQERMARNKKSLLDALKRAGAVRATVGYSGGGDEGFANEAAGFGADSTPVDLSDSLSVFIEHSHFLNGQWQSAVVQEERPLDDALSDFAMEAVEGRHGGWENGDGGAGEVVFDCASEQVRIEHNDYYTESDYTETTL